MNTQKEKEKSENNEQHDKWNYWEGGGTCLAYAHLKKRKHWHKPSCVTVRTCFVVVRFINEVCSHSDRVRLNSTRSSHPCSASGARLCMPLITCLGVGGIDGCARLGSSGRLYPKSVTTKASMLMCVYWRTKNHPLLFFSTLDITKSVLIQQAERKHVSSVSSSTQLLMNPFATLIKDAIAEGDQNWQDRINCQQLRETDYKLVSKANINWWNEQLSTKSKELCKEKQYSGQLIYKIEELQRCKERLERTDELPRCKARLARADVLIFGSKHSPSEYRHEYTVGEFFSHPHYRGKSFRQFYESNDWKAINWVAVFGCHSSRAWVRALSKYVADRVFIDGVYVMEEGVSPNDVVETIDDVPE